MNPLLPSLAMAFGALAILLALRASWLVSRSRSTREITQLKAQVTLLSDGIDALHATLRKLQMRDHARKIAAARSRNQETEPDPYRDPDGWKRWINRKRMDGVPPDD